MINVSNHVLKLTIDMNIIIYAIMNVQKILILFCIMKMNLKEILWNVLIKHPLDIILIKMKKNIKNVLKIVNFAMDQGMLRIIIVKNA